MNTFSYQKQRTASHQADSSKRYATTDVITTWACTMTSLAVGRAATALPAQPGKKTA